MIRATGWWAIGIGLSALCASNAFAWQAVEAPVFELDRSVELELVSPGRAPVRVIEEARANVRLKGLDTPSYPFGEMSAAQGAAEVKLLREDEDSIDVELDAFSKVRGWSQAKGTARAAIAVTVPSDMAKMPALLRLTASDPKAIDIVVTGPDGARISPIQGKPGYYLVADATEGKYLIQSSVSADAGDDGVPGPKAKTQSVSLRAAIERGPILFGLQTQFIYKGFETDEYKQVGSILYDELIHCTATLVAPRTILTAAHCLAGFESQLKQKRFKFALGRKASTPDQVFDINAADYPRDKSSGYFYDPTNNHADDIALAYLSSAPGITPAPVHGGTPGWTAFQSEKLLFVGYGYDGADTTSAGVKRHASWSIGQVGQRKVSWQTTGPSTCAFDSGGPAFRGNGALLVAVTSMGSDDCTTGINTRVDAFAAWLSGKLR